MTEPIKAWMCGKECMPREDVNCMSLSKDSFSQACSGEFKQVVILPAADYAAMTQERNIEPLIESLLLEKD